MTAPSFDIHLVCGSTGAGKSTYSEDLAQSIGGVRFSIDEWMQQLHNMDQPEQMSFDWFYERVQRNCVQMRNVAKRLAELNVPSVFDCGLTNKKERDIFAQWTIDQGFSAQLHYVDVATDIRWQRVQKRNSEQAETFQFEVTREMFDFIDTIWEAPSPAEMAELSGKRITS
jgi:predicted kinase